MLDILLNDPIKLRLIAILTYLLRWHKMLLFFWILFGFSLVGPRGTPPANRVLGAAQGAKRLKTPDGVGGWGVGETRTENK